MTIGEARRWLASQVCTIYGQREAAWIARLVMESITGKSDVDLLLRADNQLSEYLEGKARAIAERLLEREPVQYILGQAYFWGMTLKVTPATLIPRPETAELVDMIVGEAADRQDQRVLDLGTGSGCIAIALARGLKFPQVTAIDISADALSVASENARTLKAKVNFKQGDILGLETFPDGGGTPRPPLPGEWDIIVSNPPYIAESERAEMHPNVLNYEPATALFVPDSDPLLFYRPIIAYAASHLAPAGGLYLEINPLFARQLADAATASGLRDVSLRLDSHGHQRFLTASAGVNAQ